MLGFSALLTELKHVFIIFHITGLELNLMILNENDSLWQPLKREKLRDELIFLKQMSTSKEVSYQDFLMTEISTSHRFKRRDV